MPPRASITFGEDGKAVVSFFSAADVTSAPHEIYHLFRREMAETAAHPDAPLHVRSDWQTILEHVGAKNGQSWTREMEEAFSFAAERYILHGETRVPELAGVFERMKAWFTDLYRSVRGQADAGQMELSPAMRAVFDRMLDAGEKEAAAVARIVRALDGAPNAARLRESYAKLSAEDRQAVFKAALAQAHEGKPINVEALVLGDMDALRRIAEEPELRGRALRDEPEFSANAANALPLEDNIHGAQETLGDAVMSLERSRPELAREMHAAIMADLAEHDARIARVDLEEKIILEAARCDARR